LLTRIRILCHLLQGILSVQCSLSSILTRTKRESSLFQETIVYKAALRRVFYACVYCIALRFRVWNCKKLYVFSVNEKVSINWKLKTMQQNMSCLGSKPTKNIDIYWSNCTLIKVIVIKNLGVDKICLN